VKHILVLAFILTVSALAFSVDKTDLLLSKNYLMDIQSLDSRDLETKAYLTLAVGLKYRETIQPNYKVWFSNLYSELQGEVLPPYLQEAIEVVYQLVAVSTVSALNMLYSSESEDHLLKAVSLRAFFYDWVDTRDPRSAKQIAETAKSELTLDRAVFNIQSLLESCVFQIWLNGY
jgi:hypothetical protein